MDVVAPALRYSGGVRQHLRGSEGKWVKWLSGSRGPGGDRDV